MINYPQIDPVAAHLGPLSIRWYGIMYLLGFAIAWALALVRSKKPGSQWNAKQVEDVIFYSALGVILGGRIGYVLFYDLPGVLNEPLRIFRIWQGGMSFHGGLLGVIVAMYVYSRQSDKTFVQVADFIAPLVPLGLGAGRIGNFINGELWGKVSSVPWAMVFPDGGSLPRHPSQLYEFLLEGILLFGIVWWYSAKPRPRFAVSAIFLLGYGCARIIVEFFRVPDPQFGYLAFGWLTMGQLLSFPMVVLGGVGWYLSYKKD